MKKTKDLSYGKEGRDFVYYIDEKHFKKDRWKVDDDAAVDDDPTYFRVIKNGRKTRQHGWIRNKTIEQWG